MCSVFYIRWAYWNHRIIVPSFYYCINQPRYQLIMHLILVVFLQVASLLLAGANDITKAKDALFQKAIVESEVQSNESTRLENADFAAMLESDEEIAQEQIDQLSLVTHYTGTGYNLVRGNPEGDFNRGGIDPGIRTTNEIFSHTYTMRKKAFYISGEGDGCTRSS